MDNYVLYFDGSCWPNPGGKAAYGFVLKKNQVEVSRGHGILALSGETSNNMAEHGAVIKGLEAFLALSPVTPCNLTIYGDSEITIRHINKIYRGRSNKVYYTNYLRTMSLLDIITKSGVIIYASWIPRERNTECDELSKAD